MAHRLERHDRDLVCNDYRDDSSTGYGRFSAVSAKGNWRSARIHSDRRIDLLARPFEEEIVYDSALAPLKGLANRRSTETHEQRPGFPIANYVSGRRIRAWEPRDLAFGRTNP